MRYLIPIFGSFFFLFSLFLASFYNYNHFYEFLLIGLFLIFYYLVKELNKKTYITLYLIFILGGIIADLFLGLMISQLWYYSYKSTFEYIPLYLLIYPLGGIVMVQSFFLFFFKIFKKQEKKIYNIKILKKLALLFLMLAIILVLLTLVVDIKNAGTIFFFFMIFFVFFSLNYISEQYGNISYVGALLKNPVIIIVITFVSSYLQAIIHEYPNTFAQQWVYINLFYDAMIFNIPVLIFFVGWIFLTIIPVSVYYVVISISSE